MQELLFQNQPIMWVGPWIASLWISIAFFVCGIIYICLGRYKRKRIAPRKPTPYVYISENNPDYTALTLKSLREYLLERKAPHHVLAHTADEIEHYVDNDLLRDIIRELEHREYSGGLPSLTERTLYNQRIQEAITPNT